MADTRLTLPYQWAPRPYQQKLWRYLADGGRRAVACWHRRAGKDELCLHHTACAAHERVGNYAHMLPEYAQARKAIWTAMNPHTGRRRIDEAFPLPLRAEPGGTNEQEMMLKFKNGSTWQVVGSDNYNALMGTSYAGMVLSEFALANPAAWGYFSPILAENDGWAIFISTPRGHNHFEDLLHEAQRSPDWFAEILTNDDTQVYSAERIASELREKQALHGPDYGRALWKQEYFCSFDAAILGSIWGDCLDRIEREGRLLDFAHDSTVPVDTGWDLGRTDDTAIWFRQMRGRQIDVLDHFASPGMDIDNEGQPEKGLVQVLLARASALGIRYGTHWLPHDARPRTLAAGGKSVLQQFEDAARRHPELGRFAIAPRLDRQEGIQAGRATFPYCRFHKTRCAEGLQSLRHYHRAWDDDRKLFLDVPVHDWASHDADAWRTLSLSWKFARPQQPDSPLVDKLMQGNPVRETLGAITKRLLDRKRAERDYSLT